MPDPPIIVISIVGNTSLTHLGHLTEHVEREVSDNPDANVLKVVTDASLQPGVLQRLSELASENDLTLRFDEHS